MSWKYEVTYFDYIQGREVTAGYTNSLIKAWLLVKKYEKQWYCVSLVFRRERVKEK